jgi:leucyl aminopeptidase (aminopeptidase T)
MNSPSNKRRVFLAITETSPLSELWRAVTEHLGDAQAELVTVFVSDDRWRRAASLPFTREISGVSGSSENFTLQRAEQIDKDAVASAQCEIRQLAAEAELQVAFEFLSEHDAAQIHELVKVEQDVLIAPSFFRSRPIYAELTRLRCRILLVDSEDADTDRTPE